MVSEDLIRIAIMDVHQEIIPDTQDVKCFFQNRRLNLI